MFIRFKNHHIITGLSIIFLCLSFVVGCDNSYDVPPDSIPNKQTSQDTLHYLVTNADLIAVINIRGANDKKPYKNELVSADILSITYGNEANKIITIENTPMNLSPGVVKSVVAIKNGKYLAFLSKSENNYKPTTGLSLLDISRNKVYPVWKENESSSLITEGYPLEQIIKEIENELKK